jgi:hypothetical protein
MLRLRRYLAVAPLRRRIATIPAASEPRRSVWPRRGAIVDLDGKHMHRAGDVREVLLTEVDEPRDHLTPHLMPGVFRDEDAAGLRSRASVPSPSMPVSRL